MTKQTQEIDTNQENNEEDIVNYKDETTKLQENIEKEKDKKDFQDIFQKEKLYEMQKIDEVEKTVEEYGKITDKYGLETVLGRLPGGDFVSSAFSTFYLLYQSGELPEGKGLSLGDKIKIFGLEFVDMAGETVGKTGGKIVGGGIGIAAGTILGTPIPIIGNIIGGVAGGITGSILGGQIGGGIFDYFFKANKRSAKIFKTHCEKLRQEAIKQNIEKNSYEKMIENESKIEKKFQSNQY